MRHSTSSALVCIVRRRSSGSSRIQPSSVYGGLSVGTRPGTWAITKNSEPSTDASCSCHNMSGTGIVVFAASAAIIVLQIDVVLGEDARPGRLEPDDVAPLLRVAVALVLRGEQQRLARIARPARRREIGHRHRGHADPGRQPLGQAGAQRVGVEHAGCLSSRERQTQRTARRRSSAQPRRARRALSSARRSDRPHRGVP